MRKIDIDMIKKVSDRVIHSPIAKKIRSMKGLRFETVFEIRGRLLH